MKTTLPVSFLHSKLVNQAKTREIGGSNMPQNASHKIYLDRRQHICIVAFKLPYNKISIVFLQSYTCRFLGNKT